MALSSADILNLAQVVADFAFVVSMALLAYQINLQRKEAKFVAYEKLMSDFTQTTLQVLEHPEISDYVYGVDAELRPFQKYSREKTMALYYIDALFGLFERVWMAQRKYKFSPSDWIHWKAWLVQLSRSPSFREHFENSRTFYDSSFVGEVEDAINQASSKRN